MIHRYIFTTGKVFLSLAVEACLVFQDDSEFLGFDMLNEPLNQYPE